VVRIAWRILGRLGWGGGPTILFPLWQPHPLVLLGTRHPGSAPQLQPSTPSGDGHASCYGKAWIYCRKSESLKGELHMTKSDLERFPLGLNRDSQGGRKGGVLGSDSAL
jgi:hypothetical protein